MTQLMKPSRVINAQPFRFLSLRATFHTTVNARGLGLDEKNGGIGLGEKGKEGSILLLHRN